VGDDQMGRWLLNDLRDKGVGIRGIIAVSQRSTTVKTRVIAHDQQVVRVDKEVTTSIDRSDENLLLGFAESFIDECGCVVISDYAKGVATATLIRDLISLAKRAGQPIAVDPKVVHFSTYRNVTVLTPNLLESAAGSGMIIDSIDALIEAGRKIVEKLNCEFLIITRGDQGMTLFTGLDDVTHIPADSRNVYDVTGAGDTVISTLSLALAGGLPIVEAAYLANVAAGVVVGDVGTVPISTDRMRDRLKDLAARLT
jgi:D-beta-D-heptose 7-phosphate kinase/D-beta-D-heptose 1-phosphate adenosyltransferase